MTSISVTADRAPVSTVLKAAAPWVVSVAICVAVGLGTDLRAVGDAIGRGNYAVFATGLFGFLVAGLVLDTAFFALCFRWIAGVGRFSELIRVRAASELLMVVSVFAGLGGLAVWARGRYGISWQKATGAMLVDLLTDVGALGALALAGLLLVPAGALPANTPLDAIGSFARGTLGFYVVCVAAARLWRYLPDRFHYGSPLQVFTGLELHQFAALLGLKLLKNLAMGLFVAAGLIAFGLAVPVVAGVGFTQVALLVRGLPVTAFGIGADQLSFPLLFGAWDDPAGQVLAFSVVYTFGLFVGRAVIGLPFVGRAMEEMRGTG